MDWTERTSWSSGRTTGKGFCAVVGAMVVSDAVERERGRARRERDESTRGRELVGSEPAPVSEKRLKLWALLSRVSAELSTALSTGPQGKTMQKDSVSKSKDSCDISLFSLVLQRYAHAQ